MYVKKGEGGRCIRRSWEERRGGGAGEERELRRGRRWRYEVQGQRLSYTRFKMPNYHWFSFIVVHSVKRLCTGFRGASLKLKGTAFGIQLNE